MRRLTSWLNKLIGQNYTTPDLVAKVTGKAKYAEDFRVDGMLFCQAAAQPDAARARDAHRHEQGAGDARRERHPHRRRPARARRRRHRPRPDAFTANTKGEKALTNEPVYQGEPILAVAAVDELTAADAIEKIEIDWEPLPFVVDPVESLRPGGAERAARGQRLGQAEAAAPGPAADAAGDRRR